MVNRSSASLIIAHFNSTQVVGALLRVLSVLKMILLLHFKGPSSCETDRVLAKALLRLGFNFGR